MRNPLPPSRFLISSSRRPDSHLLGSAERKLFRWVHVKDRARIHREHDRGQRHMLGGRLRAYPLSLTQYQYPPRAGGRGHIYRGSRYDRRVHGPLRPHWAHIPRHARATKPAINRLLVALLDVHGACFIAMVLSHSP